MRGCSFTGHRAIKKEHMPYISSFVLRAITYAYEKGCRNFYTGGALGFDTVAAKEIIRFRLSHADVRFVLLLPTPVQDRMWQESDRNFYNYTLSVADEIVYSSDEYTKSCMKDRNMKLAESCDILISYMGRRQSGAGQTVAMAERLGREIYNLYPAIEREVQKAALD